MLLRVTDARRYFGGVPALNGVTFEVDVGEIVGVIGPNGSGKTTLFNCLTGFVRLNGGQVYWHGQKLSAWHLRPAWLARHGLVRTFQDALVFPNQTVGECIERARLCRASASRRLVAYDGDEEIVSILGLGFAYDTLVEELSYGVRRLVGVAMAALTWPDLLLLDEPMAGLADAEGARLAALLRWIKDRGGSCGVVDHNMHFLLPLCDRVFVLDTGENLVDGDPEAVRSSPEVIRVYLGEADRAQA